MFSSTAHRNRIVIETSKSKFVRLLLAMGLALWLSQHNVREAQASDGWKGEPMLNKELVSMIEYAISKNVGVNFPTNFSLNFSSINTTYS